MPESADCGRNTVPGADFGVALVASQILESLITYPRLDLRQMRSWYTTDLTLFMAMELWKGGGEFHGPSM